MTEVEYLATLDAYLDQGWTGASHRPSLLRRVGEAAFVTAPSGITGAINPKAGKNAADFRAWVVKTARQRWREGFYADPFTNAPVKREEPASRAGVN